MNKLIPEYSPKSMTEVVDKIRIKFNESTIKQGNMFLMMNNKLWNNRV